ncbi:hypothetical protein STEG23_013894, partial [Scotinomys teguina]
PCELSAVTLLSGYQYFYNELCGLGLEEEGADPLVGSIATQYMTNRAEHDRMARQWTKRYAT